MTTPGQTVGPFFHYALPYEGGGDLVPPGRAGAIRLHGHVYDGAGDPVPDALLELWQADPGGQVPQVGGSLRRDGWTFTGFGRAETDAAGHYSFTTLMPGGTSPFFAVTVFARGLTHRLFTRIYPPSARSEADPFLAGLEPERRDTLVATPDEHGLVFDVHLQGDNETVFLTFPGHR
ncbi:protocatechuate 3,4-dioxygenase subunit alpha [Actinoplanes sp. NBRC 103695]|uniref:protocatechuate 3,4-dioxygenase subunit alpha n=1 Tax=Actinoplanes sp. NBRC 103695 TaxID=3032202 RepID=UPI0024A22B2F|nr:protocatechuate 3,4-dioxygenase subunit alpha [Actinoplanes sp. NBRC 103695]GLZ00076.1 protocatechuate 3,4-dioxygenase subunit alpha [Actinoplanes sp. NBRC 103695]